MLHPKQIENVLLNDGFSRKFFRHTNKPQISTAKGWKRVDNPGKMLVPKFESDSCRKRLNCRNVDDPIPNNPKNQKCACRGSPYCMSQVPAKRTVDHSGKHDLLCIFGCWPNQTSSGAWTTSAYPHPHFPGQPPLVNPAPPALSAVGSSAPRPHARWPPT